MLRFTPWYRPTIWGGRRLGDELGRELPAGNVGESWELAELDVFESRVAEGAQQGRTLGELWRAGAIGGSAHGRFPFVVKWIDTRERLSVQVHPDAATCARLGQGAPKSEAWIIAHADLDATAYVGHYPGLDAATLRQAATGNTVLKWLYETRPRPGDMIEVPAGTVHTLGAGFLLLEIHEPSDTTFRIWDWGRVDPEGRPRPVHIDAAQEAVHYADAGPHPLQRQSVRGPSFVARSVAGHVSLPPDRLRVLVADSGPAGWRGPSGEVLLHMGDLIVAEPSDGELTLERGTCLVISEPD